MGGTWVGYAVLVAPANPEGEPDLDRLRAFEVQGDQAINYHANIWHHPMMALEGVEGEETAEFAMLAWEDGTTGDCEERHYAEPIGIVQGPAHVPGTC